MLTQKKNVKKRLALLLIILSVSSCASIPERPKTNLCIIDYPRLEAICGKKGVDEFKRKPLSEMDRGVVLMPEDWYDMEVYLDIVEDYMKMQKDK